MNRFTIFNLRYFVKYSNVNYKAGIANLEHSEGLFLGNTLLKKFEVQLLVYLSLNLIKLMLINVN